MLICAIFHFSFVYFFVLSIDTTPKISK